MSSDFSYFGNMVGMIIGAAKRTMNEITIDTTTANPLIFLFWRPLACLGSTY